MKNTLLILLIFVSLPNFAQDNGRFVGNNKKGQFFLYWGYNRAIFTKSTMKIKGDQYDFELSKVKAVDRPEKFSFNSYFNPKLFTIPQFNLRAGYYFKDNYEVSIGYDHMKYVVSDNQRVAINGYISPSSNANLNGTFQENDSITLSGNNFHYENTDGLNFGRIQVGRTDCWWSNNWFAINTWYAASAGIIITKNDFYWDGVMLYNKFNLSGYGVAAHFSVRADFFKHFFLMTEVGGGFIHLPNVNTHDAVKGKTQHAFGYGDMKITIGAIFGFKKKKKEIS